MDDLKKYRQLRTSERPLVHPKAKQNVKDIAWIVIGSVGIGIVMYGIEKIYELFVR
ncbi:hypothetical protein [Ectobacillus panaciterrae]|uniref:hypothetical protein n=1 Tax=Ectobacillus panaciterrae TaxID=363872 RepID=UPI0004082480|nr:hypothetical protein [Ectobacillus panaciterrae]